MIYILEEVMMGEMDQEGQGTTFKEWLLQDIGVDYIERTSRTEDIGKWLVITDNVKYEETRTKVDECLKILGSNVEETETRTGKGVGFPRRTDRSRAT